MSTPCWNAAFRHSDARLPSQTLAVPAPRTLTLPLHPPSPLAPPGSRSSPLTHAIACHPRARLNVCIDERSLGFWALGYGRAAGRPAAVVTSSGTAVANLLPAVVEASLSGVPMLLLTADRPAELRDTAANQTIDQVGRGGKSEVKGVRAMQLRGCNSTLSGMDGEGRARSACVRGEQV